MAITKILYRNGGLAQAIQYITNPDKTDQCVLVDHINCDPGFAYQQMMNTKRRFHKTDGRQCYHIIQSFKPDEITPELAHEIGMKLAEKFKEKPEVINAIGAHHDEMEMNNLISPIVQVCDAISGARPGARREVVESYIKRLKEMEDMALAYPGVMKTYAIQAGRELRVIVGSEKITDQEADSLSHDIAKKIQDEMTYPGQVKITVIRETRSVSYAK